MRTSILVLAQALLASTAPLKAERATCTETIGRKSWHALTRDERLSYIAAEKCLMTLPAKLGLPAARTRFDELQMIHVLQTAEGVHGVGQFLPFHRYYVHVHESLLRTECNYTAGQPYWDESLDAGNFSRSIILDADSGFGGNGVGKDNCISDGPFKDYVNAIGPGNLHKDHCIDRAINDCASEGAKKEIIDGCMEKKTYLEVWNCLEGSPHSAGHGGIGAQMLNVFSSPGDPLFYLHHAWLDKLWADWQLQNPSIRLSEMGGSNQGFAFGNFTFPPGGNFTFPPFTGNGTNTTFPPGGFPGAGECPPFGSFPGIPGGGIPGFPGFPQAPFQKKEGDPANVTTLGHVVTSYGALPDATVGDVMDMKGGYLCYEYV